MYNWDIKEGRIHCMKEKKSDSLQTLEHTSLFAVEFFFPNFCVMKSLGAVSGPTAGNAFPTDFCKFKNGVFVYQAI